MGTVNCTLRKGFFNRSSRADSSRHELPKVRLPFTQPDKLPGNGGKPIFNRPRCLTLLSCLASTARAAECFEKQESGQFSLSDCPCPGPQLTTQLLSLMVIALADVPDATSPPSAKPYSTATFVRVATVD